MRSAQPGADGRGPDLRALLTLVVTNVMQTLMQGGWLLARAERRSIRGVPHLASPRRRWARCRPAGSACWFIGFAYAPVALVRAVGQVEILFTLLFSRFFLGERLKRRGRRSAR